MSHHFAVLLRIALLVAVLFSTACGGEEAPRYTDAEAEGLLAQAAIVREDLRVVLPEVGRVPVERAQMTLASGIFGIVETAGLLEQSKALYGYAVDYDTTPTARDLAGGWVIAVHEELVLHNDTEGAALWVDYAWENRDVLIEQMLQVLGSDPNLDNVEAENVPAPVVGDDAFTLRIAADLTRDSRPFEVVQDFVFLRSGPISAFLIIFATRDREPIIETIIANAEARVALSLEQGPPPVE